VIDMTSSKIRFLLNLFASLCQFAVGMGISFVLTPYIVRTVSVEAYGFVGLTNNMVGYASILTIALNSVAGRFITISWHKKNHEEAASIMSSVIVTNTAIAIVLLFIGGVVVHFLEYLIDIPRNLILPVKILFILIVVNFSLSIINAVYSVSTFITDKLYLSSGLSIVSALLRVGILLGLFYFFPANIVYVGMAALTCTAVELLVNIWFKKKLVPALKLSVKRFSFPWVKTLFFSGVWNSLANLGCMLLEGCDLLFCNIWLGAYLTGQLAISKVIQSAVGVFLQKISALFAPRLTMNYAVDDIQQLLKILRVNMKMTGFTASIIYATFVTMGVMFFELWMPNKDTMLVYHLSVISLSGLLVSGAMYGLPNVYLITNKIRTNSLIVIGMGIVNLCLVIILLRFTDYGVYSIACVSVIVKFFSDFLFAPIYAAKCLNLGWRTFYDIMLRYIVSTVAMTVFFMLLRNYVLDLSVEWSVFIRNCLLLFCLGLCWNSVFLLDVSDRQRVWNMAKKRICSIG